MVYDFTINKYVYLYIYPYCTYTFAAYLFYNLKERFLEIKN